MSGLRERLTTRRLAAIGVIVALALALVALGDPLAHPTEGAQDTGERGLSGVPRVVFLAGLAIAFVLAMPPNRGSRRSDDED